MTTLTPADVAADLHIEVETVLRHLRTGLIPGFKVGRHWRVDPSELAEWKQNKAKRPGDPNRIPPRTDRSQAAIERNAAKKSSGKKN